MRYRCDNAKCPNKFAVVVGMPEEAGSPRFQEVRLATYEVDEDGSTLDLLDWGDTGKPVTCAYCHKPAKVLR